MSKTNKVDIYNLIELSAIHSLALNLQGFPGISVPDHVKPGCGAREIIDEHTWGTYGKMAQIRAML